MEKMRRQDRQVHDLKEIKATIQACHVVRLGLFDTTFPYIVPTNFGCEWVADHLIVYIHGARQGKKVRLIEHNPHVCMEMDTKHQLLPQGTKAPKYSFAYASVIGFGMAKIISDLPTKRHALGLLMYHETGKPLTAFDAIPDHVLQGTVVIQIDISELTCKAHAANS
ncbi:hypothetical protein FC83_GL001627 [Agrilactobacillus composti DSM 18527 = JCM 14202]|uniref:Pyridoxamine 5'-phosphate oxidase family protein n=1 Tax=Agrilactobacillus composti DSM 18527 = JCM 14202 TaxID=1423734 RepID=X0PDB3_9LACO|nr:pyridoxamine 5'-phosphate oxidase family protein [Agrilactobacillus composti]KRM30494.1 hypothetical protein FC83_GL001627 [Agrilactobacillus composti DSM 18527 = JCM 14202]GAF38989.1 pyridoxamine 5'-phosphate oxidase-related, FMN-binding [Agrilactobacillus composti DSM 18527 = JCM 14202]